MPGTEDELFVVDNSDEHWKALEYLRQWCDLSESIDIATGFFEIGALLALDGEWQKVDKIRILIGAETTRRTTEAIAEARRRLDASADDQRKDDPFLTGLESVAARSHGCRAWSRMFIHCYTQASESRRRTVPQRTSKVLSVSVPPDLARDFERLADEQGGNKSELFREMLRVYQTYRETGRFEILQRYGAARARALGIDDEDDVERLIQEVRHG